MRLIKGLYGHEFDHKDGPFDLHVGQMRGRSVVHNGGWYNSQGEKLGWGDLDEKDLEKVSKGLEEDEAFLVLGEHDSFWNFVTDHGPIGAMCARKPEEQDPGIKYVVEHARFAVFKGEVLRLGLYESSEISHDELLKRLHKINKGA